MVIELVESSEHKKMAGADTFEVTAGKTLKVETMPDGTEYLSVEVPAGKVWTVSVYVDIKEAGA